MKGQTGALLTGVVIIATLTGCGGDAQKTGAPVPATSGAGSAPPSSASPAGTATAPACVAGTWRTTGVSGAFGTATGRVSGGTGATMTVGADGSTEVGFTDSEPLTFGADAAGASIRGQVIYSGSVRAAVRFEPQSAGAGRWQPRDTGQNYLRATVRLTEPFSVTLLDNAGLGRLTGGELPGTGDALDALPVLRDGTYACAGETLRVHTQQDGPDLSWAFTRVS